MLFHNVVFLSGKSTGGFRCCGWPIRGTSHFLCDSSSKESQPVYEVEKVEGFNHAQ